VPLILLPILFERLDYNFVVVFNMKVQWFTDSCDICFISKSRTQEILKRVHHSQLCSAILYENSSGFHPSSVLAQVISETHESDVTPITIF